jgi:GGDEF domain-containing protein
METNKEIWFLVGSVYENNFKNLCTEYKITWFPTSEFRNWSNTLDKIYGDIFLFVFGQIIKIDVKGGSISKESIQNFKGEYFVIFKNSTTSEGLVFEASFLRDLIRKMKDYNFEPLSGSCEPGIAYKRLEQYKDNAISIIDFLKKQNTSKTPLKITHIIMDKKAKSWTL